MQYLETKYGDLGRFLRLERLKFDYILMERMQLREFAHTKQEGKSPEMVGETGPKALDNRLAFIMLITPHGDIH